MADQPTFESLRKIRLKRRNIEILRDYLAGESFRTLGKRIGMSSSQVHLICQRLLQRHYGLGAKFPQHRLPDDIVARLEEMQGAVRSNATHCPTCGRKLLTLDKATYQS
jgi:hypothetical protein